MSKGGVWLLPTCGSCGSVVEFTGRKKANHDFEVSCCKCKTKKWIPSAELTQDKLQEAFEKHQSVPPQTQYSGLNNTRTFYFGTWDVPSNYGQSPAAPFHYRDPGKEYKEAVEQVFRKTLVKRKSAFRIREPQIEMAANIADVLFSGGVLVSEAGVGTGKTFAYSVPALILKEHGLRLGPVIVSTKTISLQEQLANDLDELIRNLGLIDVSVLVSKGQNNYMCLMRLNEISGALEHGGHLLEWARTPGSSGDLGEVQDYLDPDDESKVNVEDCLGEKCSERGHCGFYYMRARRRTFQNGIIICNHNQLCADLKNRRGHGQGLWPSPGAIIMDEAHGFEEACRQTLGETINKKRFDNIMALVRKGKVDSVRLKDAGARLNTATRKFFKMVSDIEQSAGRDENNRFIIPVDSRLVGLCHGLVEALEELEEEIDLLAGFGTSKFGTGYSPGVQYLEKAEYQITKLTTGLSDFLDNRGQYYVFGEGNGYKTEVFFGPIEVGPFLEEALWGYKDRPVILTSGTLSDRESFDLVRQKLGLDPEMEMVKEYIGALKLDLSGQVGVYLAEDLPEPGRDRDGEEMEFTKAMSERVAELLLASGGRALVLFTSYSRMNYCHQYLTSLELSFRLFRQGDFSSGKLMKLFREDETSVLLATGSYWEGIDAPGRTLSMVVMDKLPFPARGEPLANAREKIVLARGGNPFEAIYLPEMLLRLKQGGGRLIRNEKDTGVIAVLDPRSLKRENYASLVREALPKGRYLAFKEVLGFFKKILG